MTARLQSAVVALVVLSLPVVGQEGTPAPLPESNHTNIGYPTVAEAMSALRSKPGVEVRVEAGWTIVSDKNDGGRDLWSFTPEGHPAHPSAVKRSVIENDGSVWIDMSVLCQAQKGPCDALVLEFKALNDRIRESMKRESAAPQTHPRAKEAEDFAIRWLDMLEKGNDKDSFELLTDTFKANLTRRDWKKAIEDSRQSLGSLHERTLRRIVWYQDPPNAPRPGTYAAVEFDSVYENSKSHFRYVMLHSLGGESFRVMRDESTVVLKQEPKGIKP